MYLLRPQLASINSTFVEFGGNTILLWACENKAMLLSWTLSAVGVHVTAALEPSNRRLSLKHRPAIPESTK